MFILRDTHTHREGEGQRERRKRIPSRLCALRAEPSVEPELTNHDMVTRAETKSQLLTS